MPASSVKRTICFFSDSRGNMIMIAALVMPVLLGFAGLGTEVASWYANKRGLQNAADSAVIAAATNAEPDRYEAEAKAVTAQYGYADGVDGVTVDVADSVTCPDGKDDCYRVTITRT